MFRGYLDGNLLIEYTSDRPLEGYVGLSMKADSVVHFEEVKVQTPALKRNFGLQQLDYPGLTLPYGSFGNVFPQ
jgi:hypothetical protein